MKKSYIFTVGSNPLPIYIACRYFITNVLKNNENETEFIFIHSSNINENKNINSQEIAKTLEKLLSKVVKDCNSNVKFDLFPIDNPFDFVEVTERIEKDLIPKQINSDVHINFTGGTKVLSSVVYHTFTKKHPILKSSYLSSHDHNLYISDEITPKRLNKIVKISFEDIIDLHGLISNQKQNKNDNIPSLLSLKPILTYYEQIINDRTIYEKYWKLSNEIAETKKYKFLKNNESEIDVTINYIINNLPYKNDEIEKISKLNIDFLKGKWLEYYVYDCIDELMKNKCAGKYEIKLSWHLMPKGKSTDYDFEIDIILLNGYQITAISITTSSSIKACKGKSFEVFHRSKQIGGDFAKSILITMMHEDTKDDKTDNKTINDLKQNLEDSIFYESKFLLLGFNDLKKEKLKRKIGEFLNMEDCE